MPKHRRTSPGAAHYVPKSSGDKIARLWPVLPAGVPLPDWCDDFLVWLGGKRIAPDGQIDTLFGDKLLKLEARLRPHMNEDTNRISPHSAPVQGYSLKPTTTTETGSPQLHATECPARRSLPEFCKHRVRRPTRAPRHHSKPVSADPS
jgi:hypothetical protein